MPRAAGAGAGAGPAGRGGAAAALGEPAAVADHGVFARRQQQLQRFARAGRERRIEVAQALLELAVEQVRALARLQRGGTQAAAAGEAAGAEKAVLDPAIAPAQDHECGRCRARLGIEQPVDEQRGAHHGGDRQLRLDQPRHELAQRFRACQRTEQHMILVRIGGIAALQDRGAVGRARKGPRQLAPDHHALVGAAEPRHGVADMLLVDHVDQHRNGPGGERGEFVDHRARVDADADLHGTADELGAVPAPQRTARGTEVNDMPDAHQPTPILPMVS